VELEYNQTVGCMKIIIRRKVKIGKIWSWALSEVTYSVRSGASACACGRVWGCSCVRAWTCL